MRTLSALLAAAVAARPDAPAVTDETGTRSWRDFARHSEGMAAQFAGLGVGAGARVALWLPNSADYLAAIFALARLSAIAVHVNTRFRTSEVGYLLRRSRAELLVTEWDFPPVDFPAILAALPAEDRAHLRHVLGRNLPAAASEAVRPLAPAGACPDRATPEAPCLTFTTSGTTSGPKLVLHAQHAIAGHAADIARAWGIGAPDAALFAAVPFCGTFGNAAAMAPVAGGAHIVCQGRFDAAEADALIRRHGVTHMVAGDDMLARLTEAAAGRRHTSLRSSNFAAFSPAAPAIAAAAQAIGLAPAGVYGSSEVQALFSLAPAENRLAGGGVPVSPAAEVDVRDPETGERLPRGTSGELCIRAPSLFLGYLENEEATRRAFTADGFFRTGDLGRLEGAGFVYEARLGDTLRLGGFMVNPEEIEGYIQSLPGVGGVQVVGVERGGERLAVAFIVPAPGAEVDPGAIIAACRAGLARYKVPARVAVLDAFPITQSANGPKIQRVKLREAAAVLMQEQPA
jgi:fatty-acyl-CoA synthase